MSSSLYTLIINQHLSRRVERRGFYHRNIIIILILLIYVLVFKIYGIIIILMREERERGYE